MKQALTFLHKVAESVMLILCVAFPIRLFVKKVLPNSHPLFFRVERMAVYERFFLMTYLVFVVIMLRLYPSQVKDICKSILVHSGIEHASYASESSFVLAIIQGCSNEQ